MFLLVISLKVIDSYPREISNVIYQMLGAENLICFCPITQVLLESMESRQQFQFC
jgi:hypothetical protein